MSKITLAPNASGTGTLTVAAPNTNSDYTLTLPAETGTVLTSASPTVYPKGVPVFSIYRGSDQSLTSGVGATVQLDTVSIDTHSFFDSGTYSWKPTIPGYYCIQGTVQINGTSLTVVVGTIQKNGATEVSFGKIRPSSVSANIILSGGGVVYLNGSTDSVSLGAQASGTSPIVDFVNSANTAILSGFLVRAD